MSHKESKQLKLHLMHAQAQALPISLMDQSRADHFKLE